MAAKQFGGKSELWKYGSICNLKKLSGNSWAASRRAISAMLNILSIKINIILLDVHGISFTYIFI